METIKGVHGLLSILLCLLVLLAVLYAERKETLEKTYWDYTTFIWRLVIWMVITLALSGIYWISWFPVK